MGEQVNKVTATASVLPLVGINPMLTLMDLSECAKVTVTQKNTVSMAWSVTKGRDSILSQIAMAKVNLALTTVPALL